MSADTISLVANVALTLSFIVALVFGVAQVRAAARDRKERLTLDSLRHFQTREFAELIQYVTANELPASRDELLERPVAEQVTFIQLAQEMEMLGILVAENYVSLGLVDKTLGSFVTQAWEKCKPLSLHARAASPDPYLNEYFQWLAETIDARMRREPRAPFYESRAGDRVPR